MHLCRTKQQADTFRDQLVNTAEHLAAKEPDTDASGDHSS